MDTDDTYAIRFEVDGEILYAGRHKGALGALGWAPTLATALHTALLFHNTEDAGRNLANGYGAMTEHGKIVRVVVEEI